MCDPKVYRFGMWIILSWRHLRPSRLKRNFYISLNYIRNLDRGPGSQRQRVIGRDNFHLNDLSMWQCRHLITRYLFFSLSYE